MTCIHKLYRKIGGMIPRKIKIKTKTVIDLLFDIGKKQYFSQFGEDAFLQGYFEKKACLRNQNKNVPFFLSPEIEKGFYVDVGAFSPKRFSNTYWFYTREWHGINIDATPGSMKAFNLVRRRDINIEVAISDQVKEVVFYCWGMPNVFNTISQEYSQQWAKKLSKKPDIIRLKTKRIESVLDDYLTQNQLISFLSVDVEGHDLEVLQSNNWEKYRPELVIVEIHGDCVEEIIGSDITAFMKKVGYNIYSWIRPSVVFRDDNYIRPSKTTN